MRPSKSSKGASSQKRHDAVADITWNGNKVIIHGNARSIYRCPYCARPGRAWALKKHIFDCPVMVSEGRDSRLGFDLRRAEIRLMTAQHSMETEKVVQAQKDVR